LSGYCTGTNKNTKTNFADFTVPRAYFAVGEAIKIASDIIIGRILFYRTSEMVLRLGFT